MQTTIPGWPLLRGAVAALFLCGFGCSTGTGEIERFAIDGEVTFNGQPVSSGTITLEPDAKKGNKGPASTGLIENAKFTIPASRGVVGGAYIARLTGYGSPPDTSGADINFGTPLFTEYEVQLELPAEKTTQMFDVPAKKK